MSTGDSQHGAGSSGYLGIRVLKHSVLRIQGRVCQSLGRLGADPVGVSETTIKNTQPCKEGL